MNDKQQKRCKVGELRPSQALTTFGIGAIIDLPHLSVMVMGLEDWPLKDTVEIGEQRLLASVKEVLGPQVNALRSAPVVPDTYQVNPFDPSALVGIPVAPFPRWMVCPHCRRLAPLGSSLFKLETPYRTDQIRYVHGNCSKAGKPPTVVPARFIMACKNGHLDDFPWRAFVHRTDKTTCKGGLKLIETSAGGETTHSAPSIIPTTAATRCTPHLAMPACSHRKLLASEATNIWIGLCWYPPSKEATWRSLSDPMNDEHHHIAAAAARLADRLPHSVMFAVADAVVQTKHFDRRAAWQAILERVPTPEFRDSTEAFLDRWHSAGRVGAEAVALALVTAARCEHDHRHDEIVELAWTGPEPADTRFRRTEQAILEVINSATTRLTIVSYAVYRIPRIRDALVAAAGRGVGIRLIVETPNRIEGQGEYDCLLALGRDVASACSVYYWPQENRGKDDNGKIGILHVKCAVADGHRMFLSSANLTEYAFTINMELGLLVTGGKLPEQVEQHFERLISAGTLLRV